MFVYSVKILIFLTSLIKIATPKECVCVPFFQCSDDDNIVADGRGLIDFRKSDECKGVFEVCCNSTLPITTSTEPSKIPKGCGHYNQESFHWSASLLYKQYPNFVPSYKCRISLIHEKVAITAAHCLQDKGYYLVRIGNTVRKVENITIHPDHNELSLKNDIAIIFLNKPFKVDKTGTVCIPPKGIILDNSNCTTATKVEENMKILNLAIVPKKDCLESFRTSRLGRFFQLHDSFICAGGEVDGTCGGDGGSPLICPVPGVFGRYHQVGIVSWGIGCGGNLPGAYVNLGNFREWIDEVMESRGFDTSSYKV